MSCNNSTATTMNANTSTPKGNNNEMLKQNDDNVALTKRQQYRRKSKEQMEERKRRRLRRRENNNNNNNHDIVVSFLSGFLLALKTTNDQEERQQQEQPVSSSKENDSSEHTASAGGSSSSSSSLWSFRSSELVQQIQDFTEHKIGPNFHKSEFLLDFRQKTEPNATKMKINKKLQQQLLISKRKDKLLSKGYSIKEEELQYVVSFPEDDIPDYINKNDITIQIEGKGSQVYNMSITFGFTMADKRFFKLHDNIRIEDMSISKTRYRNIETKLWSCIWMITVPKNDVIHYEEDESFIVNNNERIVNGVPNNNNGSPKQRLRRTSTL